MVKIAFKMKMAAAEWELFPRASTVLTKCFTSIPDATVAITQDGLFGSRDTPDFTANVIISGQHTTIAVELKKSGEPRFAREAIHQLHAYRRNLDLTTTGGVFMAPYVSEATAKLCQDEGVGYLDLAGNCHIAFRGVYIHIEGKPNPFAHSRSLLSLYQPKAERVLRVLLTYPSRPWRIQSLADEATVSVGQTFKVKELLIEREWLEETERGLLLTKPLELLAAWAERYRFDKHHAAQFYTLLNIETFAQLLSVGCRQRSVPCAFTSFTAAARYAPYATYRRTTAYVHHEMAEVQELLQLKRLQLDPVETGADVILLSPYDDGVFYGGTQQEDVSLASPIQTYLDLQDTGGRGQEAAEVLLQKGIIPSW